MLIDADVIQKAKEALGDRNAELIQELLQMDKYDERRKVGCCPNPAHMDNNPSCSYNPKAFSFHCFSCGFNVDLLDAYMIATGCTFVEACELLLTAAQISYDFSERLTKSRGAKHRYPNPEYGSNMEYVYAYWEKRKISRETIDYLGIRQDPRGNTMFCYYDLNDVLVDVKYRLSRKAGKGECKCWHPGNIDSVNVLYNINKVNPASPLIITSGEGDCATCVECGFYNATSINGGDQNLQWVGECWDWLQQFSEIIIVHDNDESGKKFAKNVTSRLGEFRTKIVDIPRSAILEDGTEVQINDLNELLFYCGKEAVQHAIQSAKETEIPAVVDYSAVEKFDMSEVEGFTTGFREMDYALDKFYMGTTTVLTGITGSGKSSFLSTLICKSVEQQFPVFVYSGELSNPSLKNWIDCVHAGQRGMQRYQRTTDGSFYYKIKPEVYQRINEFYRGQIFFYKDGFDQTVSKIMSTAEGVVRRHGVRTLVFDNLTSMDLENNDDNKYQRQEEFIREVINFSKRWNVCCVIVLHPKKMDMVRRMTLFDLQGVSAATNLAHRVLALYRVPPKEKAGVQDRRGNWITPPCPFDVTIEVLKDRFGSGGGRTVGLYYDQPSRRFYDCMATLDYIYDWDNKFAYEGVALPFGSPQLESKEVEAEVYGERIQERPYGK